MNAQRGPKTVTPEHKAAMKRGREQSRAVRQYLEALESTKPKRGRRRTKDAVEQQLAAAIAATDSDNVMTRLEAIQRSADLKEELAAFDQSDAADLEQIETEFVRVAAEYSATKGIVKSTWRAVGVPADVLKRAGVR